MPALSRIRAHSRGTAVLEYLTSACTASVLALILFLLLKSSVLHLAQMRSAYAGITSRIVLYQRISEIVSDADSHPFTLLPRVHTDGEIRFTDGSLNQVVGSARPPAADSHAVTYVSLDSANTFLIENPSPGGYGFTAQGCPHFAGATGVIGTTQFLAAGPSGFSEIVTAASGAYGGAACREFDFTIPEKSMIGSQQAPFIRHARLLIPVQKVYSFYLDRSGTLRHLSHEGGRNSENQPIADEVHPFELGLDNDPASGLLQLTLRTKNVAFHLVTRIPRASLPQVLLWRRR